MKWSAKEKKDLLKAWAAISVAFAILFSGGRFDAVFFYALPGAAITVGVGFLFHELAHKAVAQKFGCWAEFRSNDRMLVIAIVTAFFGLVFAAPGGVFIRGRVDKQKTGMISAAGIVANLGLALLFFLGRFFYPFQGVHTLLFYGGLVNAFLALFNLIPFPMFDGAKVLLWDKKVYGSLVGLSILMMAIQYV